MTFENGLPDKFNGIEIKDNVFLIGEPYPIPGTNKMRCLANFHGYLALIELKVTFAEKESK